MQAPLRYTGENKCKDPQHRKVRGCVEHRK